MSYVAIGGGGGGAAAGSQSTGGGHQGVQYSYSGPQGHQGSQTVVPRRRKGVTFSGLDVNNFVKLDQEISKWDKDAHPPQKKKSSRFSLGNS